MPRNGYALLWSGAPDRREEFVTNWRKAQQVHIDDCLTLLGFMCPESAKPARERMREHVAKVRRMRYAPLADIESPSHAGRAALWQVVRKN